jgi:hypothetical protein
MKPTKTTPEHNPLKHPPSAQRQGKKNWAGKSGQARGEMSLAAFQGPGTRSIKTIISYIIYYT